MAEVAGLAPWLDLAERDGRYTVPPSGPEGFHAAGMLAAFSVAAAGRAVPDEEIRSAHSLFLRPASPAAAIDIDVELLHRGRQVSAVQLRLTQAGRLCATTQVLLGPRLADLIRHEAEPPAVEPPDGLPLATADNLAEVRVPGGVDPFRTAAAAEPRWAVWARAEGLPADSGCAEAYVAYQANAFLVSAAVLPHEGVSMHAAHNDLMAVINSSDVVFHRPVGASAWLLFSQESTFAGGGWVFGRGQVFDADGGLVASYAEEAMLRALPTGNSPGL